jgi:hypothetical protein
MEIVRHVPVAEIVRLARLLGGEIARDNRHHGIGAPRR